MKLRKFITRRRLMWVGFVASLLLLTFSLTSIFWFSVNHVTRGPNSECGISLHWGRVWVWRRIGKGSHSWYTPQTVEKLSDPGFEFRPLLSDANYNDLGGGSGRFQQISLPLWLPIVLIAFPTAWLWRVDRRIQPWQCRGCRYDLRGLEGGGEKAVCPECGLSKGEG